MHLHPHTHRAALAADLLVSCDGTAVLAGTAGKQHRRVVVPAVTATSPHHTRPGVLRQENGPALLYLLSSLIVLAGIFLCMQTYSRRLCVARIITHMMPMRTPDMCWNTSKDVCRSSRQGSPASLVSRDEMRMCGGGAQGRGGEGGGTLFRYWHHAPST